MNFNEHWNLTGKHAFLSPSQYHWLNYDPEKLEERFFNSQAIERGTKLHAYAEMAIRLNRKQPKSKDTVNMFINDAIGYSMIPEQPLYYSENCFGTADAISFNRNLLRIHDLKTGATPASFHQLEIYGALFCLEYMMKPSAINMEFRIYQLNEKHIMIPEPEVISDTMSLIVEFDSMIEKFKESMK